MVEPDGAQERAQQLGQEASHTAPRVAICAGKSCRKNTGFTELTTALSESCDLVNVRCLGECKGPMVVVRLGAAEPVVLTRVRRSKQRRDLLAFLSGVGLLSERLERRRLVGRKREKAIEKARRDA